jgi:hypothetical protein
MMSIHIRKCVSFTFLLFFLSLNAYALTTDAASNSTAASPPIIQTNIAYNGWSTMLNSLSGQNTASSTSPSSEHDPSLFNLVGQMYEANGLSGYSSDFSFLPQGSEFIDGTEALNNINTTSATVAVLSAYGSRSGINMDPVTANAAGGWIDRMVNAAVAAEARDITPIMFQSWGSAGTEEYFPNAKINSDALQAKHGMLVVRTAEIVQSLGQLNSAYTTNSVSPGGGFFIPVTHLYSGDSSDNFHGSYAMAYANALATFKCLTGISALNNSFVIPSGGAAGIQYGMTAEFISDIIVTVDAIQQESLVSGLADGAAPIATNFSRDAVHDIELNINVSAAATLLDDVAPIPQNFAITSITDEHFSHYTLTNHVFSFTPSDSYVGTSDVTFTYIDADEQSVTMVMTLTITAEAAIEPQEIIIGFGLGNWTSFSSTGNLYNHTETETGKVINGIRTFSSQTTLGDLQDSNGVGIGTITSLTSGNLAGLGFTANDDPVVSHYGPYTALYAGLSAAPSGSLVAFSINGLDAGVNYRINMAGRYGEEVTNIVSVNVNGVEGAYDSSGAVENINEFEKVVTADNSGKLRVTLSSDGTSTSSRWGLSYVHINKILDGTVADSPVAPSFTLHPESTNVTEGANVTFTVALVGTYSLQWYRDDVIINGETAPSYTLTTANGDDGAVFTAKATNVGGTTTSTGAVLGLLTDIPSIGTQPASAVSIVEGNLMNLSVTATGAVGYQWQKNAVDILGETHDSLSLSVETTDSGAEYRVILSNPFGHVISNSTQLTVTPVLQQYWFSFGRNDGKASSYTDSFNNGIPNVDAEGNNGEGINFIRSFTNTPVTRSNIFRDTLGEITDLSMTYTNTGSNTDSINAWNRFNSDIILNPSVVANLTANNWLEHTNLYAFHVYMAADHIMQFEFSAGGLVVDDQWQVQALGLHYQDKNRPVDVIVNGVGTPGNMQVGDWGSIDVFNQIATVDSNGKLTISISPDSNANINALRLIRISTTPTVDDSIADDDNDGVVNADDTFPQDPTEWLDSDGDGTGNNADNFANNAAASIDADNDGLPDVWHANCDTHCQQASNLILDTSLDDFDNDGVITANDAFPDDSSEWADANGNGVGDNAEFLNAGPTTVQTNIAYNGWSTMSNTLSGQNTGSSTSPSAEHDPSLFALVGEMYVANGIADYVSDFGFLPQGSDSIDGTDALNNINTTSATVVVLSAYGSTSGINMAPENANAAGGWVDRMVNAAVAAEARNITPIMFQSWGSSNAESYFPNAKINTDAVQAKHGMLVVRTAEIVAALGQLNAAYTTNSESSGGKYVAPITHLYSGDTGDNFHGSYAMAYANALATFKSLTGISAAENAFVIPSGGVSGTQYGMSDVFIQDIISTVDAIQQESIISGLADGAAPIASDFARDGTHLIASAINVSAAAAVLDDVAVIPANFAIESITAEHFDDYALTNHVFTYTPADTFTGLTEVMFTYIDADAQPVNITMILTVAAEASIESQEIIIGFGLGHWSSFSSTGNLYKHAETETGKVINGIRGFDLKTIIGNLQDSTGGGIGSITSLTSGNLSGPGFAANEDPVVSHYGPYTALYAGLSVAPKGTTVSFSVNGLDAGANYRINMAGRYVEEVTNIVNVNVNGVEGSYDSNSASTNVTEFEKVVTANNSGKLLVTLISDGTTTANRWGISYVHINKIYDGTEADTPVVPTFEVQPESTSVTEGSNVTLTVAVLGSDSLQWYRDDVILNGETALSYTLTTLNGDDGAVFTAKATNAGGTTTSAAAVLMLLTDMPIIDVQPESEVSVVDGNLMNISVVATGAVDYQWQKNSVDIPGQIHNTLSLNAETVNSGAEYQVVITNPFGRVISDSTTLTVTPVLQQYWFAFGRNDGKASSYTDAFNSSIPNINAEGNNGEDINFFRSFEVSPMTRAGIFRDTSGAVTDLSMTYTSTGLNTDSIKAWNNYNSDVTLNAGVVANMTAKSWFEHTNLYAYHLYMAADQTMQFEFSAGGLVAGDQWQVQALGLHYQDKDRPVDVLINGEGASGNMHVGDWNSIDVFDTVTTVDENGKLTLSFSPHINANLNAIRLIRRSAE